MLTSGALSSLEALIPAKQREMLQRQNWQTFQAHIDRRLRMYADNWVSMLRRYIISQISPETQAQFFDNPVGINRNPTEFDDVVAPRWPLPITINLIKRVVNEISLVYNTTANRTFSLESIDETNSTAESPGETVTEDSERFAEIVGADYNNKMAYVNRLVNLCNCVLIRPVVDANYESGFRLDIITPDMFTPIQSLQDPERLIGVTYVIDLTDTPSTLNTTRKEILIYMGEEGEEGFIAEIDNGNYTQPEKKPYPFLYKSEKYLPFAVFRNEEPLLGEFINRTSGRDLYLGTLQTGYLLSLWMRAYREASGKQIIISGKSAGEFTPKSFIKDEAAVWMFPFDKDTAMIEQLDHSRDLTGQWEALERYMESVLNGYGISLDKFKAVPQSGISLKIQNESIIQLIKGQWPYYRRGETDLANIIRKLNNTTPGMKGIPDDYEFVINFGPLPYEPEPVEMYEKLQPMVDAGYLSSAQLMMMIDPDIKSEEDAQEQILRNLQANRALKKSSAQFAMPNSALTQGAQAPVAAPNLPMQPKQPNPPIDLTGGAQNGPVK
jgi:hypothetical protein